jgi:hypothetical protein
MPVQIPVLVLMPVQLADWLPYRSEVPSTRRRSKKMREFVRSLERPERARSGPGAQQSQRVHQAQQVWGLSVARVE